MKRSKKAAIRLVLSAWRNRGWRDQDDAALAIVEAFEKQGGSFDPRMTSAVPASFLDRNSISRADVEGELSRVLADLDIDDSSHVAEEPERLKIVFFAANPHDQAQLRLDEEAREIESRIRASDYRDVIDLATKWAVRPGDLIEALNRERPQVIHFSGHGSASDQLVFQDDFGGSKTVSKEALGELVRLFSDEVRVVVFNNCFSEAHAEVAALHVEAAVGMSDSISDEAARIFAAGFYAALGYGRSIQDAFEQARAALQLEGIPEEETPQLFVGTDIDPHKIVLVARAS